ncbi:bifunctional 2',3'-cyclic-nucleotide 2'-phosphodiesterase/3'-nucleotidase [Bosea sp. BH3]|uniref:bifunctional 2',3'-cyclic-nucleotide 2'-phosphodiesterase/3'-nucleotidase n=1 Tax=Bosea sp. BH3 TaxID=2871701 RepID=UPI0021CB8B82|nr:bifunctional 2',3'-cyclic-nucleotide 2'-phosphodiesterase/3'-nucleotidase [Bosea sp. BH3]MCU4181967.1 bifunctional 2',3'-cyclic-nucleotide 2'-phosphodiesterase/3'-nucleotidase [Bosea sp. BH3]
MAKEHRLSRRETLRAGAAAAADTTLSQGGPTQRAYAQSGPAPGASAEGTASAPARLKLRVLETTDLHVNIVPYDYFRDGPDETVGFAKTASLIRAAQAEAKNSLLFDNGDFLQGSSLGDYIAYKKGLKAGDTHPMIAAMNTLPYLCGTLGNHEFNYGLEFLETGLATAEFPLVCANVERVGGGPLLDAWQLFEQSFEDEAGSRHVLKIGVIGFVPPQIMQWDKANIAGKLVTFDIVEAAERHLPDLLAAAPDLVIALCHSGIAGSERRGMEENAALHLAAIDGIDVVLTGHQHLVFPGADVFDGIDGIDNVKGALHGKPACQPGFWGSHLGIVDLDLEKTGGRWRIADFRVEAKPIFERISDSVIVPKISAEPAVLAAVEAAHEAALAYMREPAGHTSAPINSYFALVIDDASVQIVGEAQIAYARPLMAQTPWKDLPILSAAAPFKSGGLAGPSFYTDIPAGPLALKNIADVYLYPNTIQILKISGAEVREWLERSAGIFNRIDPARDEEQPLIDPTFPAFNFDVMDGVTYRIDVTQASRYDHEGKLVAPDAHRIAELSFAGRPIDEAASFIVVTNNYRASGGGNFPGTRTTVVLEAPDLNRDAVVRHIVGGKSFQPRADGNWSLLPLPAGVTATFLTSPAAAGKLPPGLKATAIGNGPKGFAKYRLGS